MGSKHLWLYGAENVPEERFWDFWPLRNANLKTARAWAIKETLRALWDMPTLARGEALYKRWHFWATHSRLRPVIKSRRWSDGICPECCPTSPIGSPTPRARR